METVESIERKMRIERIIVRTLLFILLLALCFLVGWLISGSGYEGIEHEVFDWYQLRDPLLGHA